MLEYDEKEMERVERLNQYIIRDEDTDEIIGLKDNAPDDVRADYDAMVKRMNSETPEDR